MVSTRPSPTPARGRIPYPTAATYTPGDSNTSPAYLGASEPIQKTTSRDSERERRVQGLKNWWKGFRESEQSGGPSNAPRRGVFGEPLAESIEYASVQVSTNGPDGSLYVWGVIPVVVAKCGLYLKENATGVEGTFRISGSAKRMRELQTLFDTPPKYGKNVDWKSLPYTTHDVATIFRRFLTQMPEPIIPFDFYDDFRNVLSSHLSETLSADDAIAQYKSLIQALPRIHLYLLLYVLDLLSVFARRADKNLMTAPNLALIFQPGVLSHPLHQMRPKEHVLSQQVLEFLIEHQDHFLLGMELKPKKKRKEKAPSTVPQSPPLVKADSDMMLPSESDDEAPAGGYYVIEGPGRPTSPASPPASTLPNISAANLLPSPPVKPNIAPPDLMEMSESDEEAPPGGYEIRTGNPASLRATLLAKALARGEGATPIGTGVARRRTLPSRRPGEFVPRLKRTAKEAP
ncbi:rho GTPase activator [Kwoniella mangroviensis CBS 8886]|nr:rho GTPase activator [Kwoniella mangroviensis CBS 8886]